jgi:acetoin utilization deacetylase AcuC-like enzyme
MLPVKKNNARHRILTFRIVILLHGLRLVLSSLFPKVYKLMNQLAFTYHEAVQHHETSAEHPEKPSRTQKIYEAVSALPWIQEMDMLEARPAEVEWLTKAHAPDYRQFIEEACLSGGAMVDSGETLIGERSYEAALYSAGGALTAVDFVLGGHRRRAFSCGRPPGHHASRDKAMGFCLFNNAAIAARYAQQKYGCARIFILDWDVHHGNGTQAIFEEDPSVYFCSLHQSPLYPNSGYEPDRGKGAGEGFTLNIELPPHSTYAEYQSAFRKKVFPTMEAFQPDLLILSAGFDAHREDPLADMLLEDQDYARLTRSLLEAIEAIKNCVGLVSVLEGGYHVPALTRSVCAHLDACVELFRRRELSLCGDATKAVVQRERKPS